ncbi:uncharacterized protein A1O9_05960 [Exophiala aquamarina CBS 119918]|uniref:RNA polymerase-associated protein LEO1 n=1 Tax=Exophiala aquamarina CBS 119918 TaxID=1182545 RepID=A0A072PE30_9EURO|nr:uncharacterized protein A1O9_05960 [Exophiala aquamarina CBS 119918]KEF58037.1 hypothetical protein A1O9_05960 [Exophiala aquamarina CBS 119918]
MSAEVDTPPSNGDVDDNLTPEGLNGGGSEDDADLFGDDDDGEVQGEANEYGPIPSSRIRMGYLERKTDYLACRLNRKLDDSELDSGDDEGRTDRIEPTIEDNQEDNEFKQVRMLQVDLARIKPPEGDDLYFLNMPPFLGVKHKAFQPSTYEPPTVPHEARDRTKTDVEAGKFSAFSTASTTMFWRRDPKTPSLIQSNTRMVRWSDGSMTLQIASQPKDHYRMSTNPLRQAWPKTQGGAGGGAGGNTSQDYDPNKDTHNYLAAPHSVVGVDLQIVAPFDATLKIQPTGDYVDESVLKLQQSLAAATEQHDPIAALRPTRIDPELAKREAEKFEKERVRANRKVEAARERLITRKDRVMGRAGMGGRLGGTGLSIAGLEDEDGMPGARGSHLKAKAKRRKTNRRGEIYSDDEDEDMPRGRREDEYDREDDFLAASDEEPEIYDDDGDEVEAEDDDPDVDDLEIEGRDTVVDSRTRGEQQGRSRGRERGSTPKRSASGGGGEDDDDDTAGPLPQGSPQRGKRRRIIDDDDEDE